MPLAQFYNYTEDMYSYDVRGVKFSTDQVGLIESDAWLDELIVTINPDERLAIADSVALSRNVGSSETMTTFECWTTLYAYANGIGSTLEKKDSLVGESCELDENIVHLIIRPAEDYNPIVVFCIQNKDGSEYTIETTYRDASSLGK